MKFTTRELILWSVTHHMGMHCVFELPQIPWFETPIVFDIRAKPRSVASLTGTKGQTHVFQCTLFADA